MKRSDDFRSTVRAGVRAGRRTLVVHAAAATEPAPPQVGLVVSRAVGNAVTRNRVKRILRHSARSQLPTTPKGTRVVVRALPPAADSPDLAADLDSAWRQGLRRLARDGGDRIQTAGSART